MKCKVSIIVPVYQAKAHIRKCLLSLLNQRFSDYEIICVDDGSTDGTEKIIQEFEKKHENIKYVYQENRGVSSARNHGMQEASGKYVMFVDADDYIKTNSLKYLYRKAEKEQADILVFGGRMDTNWKAPEWMRMAFYTQNKIYEKFEPDIMYNEIGVQPSVCNKFILREILEGFTFQENIHIAEDQAFLFAIFPRASKIVFSSKSVYRYRTANQDSAMHRTREHNSERMRDHLNAAEIIICYWKQYGYLSMDNMKFSKWLTAFLREPYNFLTDTEKKYFLMRIEKIYKSINLDNQLLIPESKYEGDFDVYRFLRIMIRDIHKLGIRGGIENLIYKLFFRG